jgi:3-oxoacyl-[acyl-carrier-protein] synthase III
MSRSFLTRASVWLPEGFEDSQQIAQQTGVPELVVRQKMGIQRKCRARADEHPSMMATEAAKAVLKGIDPQSIDCVIWTGSEYKDYPVWSAGIFVQRELGLEHAHAYDIAARCSTNVLGLRMARATMIAHPEIKRILLCGGHKTGDLVNYQDPNARFLNNLADGGSAMLVEREGYTTHDLGAEILQSSIVTDGAFSTDVIIPGGGTRRPAHGGLSFAETCLTVPDVAGMRERLGEKSFKNFLQVINTAAKTSMPERPIDYLALLHMKKSAHDEIVRALELADSQSIYLDQYGHFGAPDQVLSLGLAERQELLESGDHVVLASAGIGYTWSAISLKWMGPVFEQSTLTTYS